MFNYGVCTALSQSLSRRSSAKASRSSSLNSASLLFSAPPTRSSLRSVQHATRSVQHIEPLESLWFLFAIIEFYFYLLRLGHYERKYTVSQKDQRYFPFTTFPNVGRFSKFFHRWIQQEICNETFVMFSTTP